MRRVLVPHRRQRILDEVRSQGVAHVEALSRALGVSASTVRRDLAELTADGLVRRARGGAYLEPAGVRADVAMTSAPTPPGAPTEATGLSVDAADIRARIGAGAADYVKDGQTILVLGGSTTAALLPHLGQRAITVVTNGITVAAALAPYPAVEVVVLGGVLHREQLTLLGAMTEQNWSSFHIDVMFAGAYGIDPEVGVTGAKLSQGGNHRAMLRHVDRLMVMADASKFGRQGPVVLAELEQVDTFLTDTDAPAPVVNALRNKGARVVVT